MRNHRCRFLHLSGKIKIEQPEGNIVQNRLSYRKARKGFTLVEILLDFAIVTLVSTAVVSAYLASFKSIELAKAKIAAVAIANEKMEILRNMPYDELATEYGPIYPPGDILDSEEVIRKGIRFNASTVITCVDDSFDGQTPTDKNICDYKRLEVTVAKQGRSSYLSKLSSFAAAKAAETDSNTGIIKICVVDANSQALPEAEIRIQNANLTPPLDIATTTDNTGCAMVPNLPPDQHFGYHITITKSGYSTAMTYDRTPQNPNEPFADPYVGIQQVTDKTFSIDRTSDLAINLVDTDGNPVSNANVQVHGAKIKYINPPTYKYSETKTTDETGRIVLPDMEFDDYTLTVENRIIASTSPYQPVQLHPGQDLSVLMIAAVSTSSPRINEVEPVSSRSGETVSVLISGKNYTDGLSAKLTRSGETEIVGSNIVVDSHAGEDTVEADFNLNGAAAGLWDIIITNPDGSSLKQVNGFEVK